MFAQISEKSLETQKPNEARKSMFFFCLQMSSNVCLSANEGCCLLALIQTVFHVGDRFWHEKISAQKIKETIFFQDRFYSLQAHAHYFPVFIYLATWRAAKLGIFTHFMFTNLPRCSQSMNSIIYIFYTDPQLLFMSAWSVVITLLHTTAAPPPKSSVLVAPGLKQYVQHFSSQFKSSGTCRIIIGCKSVFYDENCVL